MSDRTAVIEPHSLRGTRFARELAAQTDSWLADVWHRTLDEVKVSGKVALVAIGGYGRGELAPYSDLDVMLLHDGQRGIDDLATALWYPIWDAGRKLGHVVCTSKQALERARDHLASATPLLAMRTIAGDPHLGERLANDACEQWRKNASRNLPALMENVRERQNTHGEVAYLLEPNIKEGYGGLRDIHALSWAEAAGIDIRRSDRLSLESARDILMNVRVELHRLRGRTDEVVRLEDQDALAVACGYSSADALMSSLSSVGRTVAWVGDEVWARVDATRRKPAPDKPVTPGVILRSGDVHLDDTIDPASDPTLLLRVATAAARHRARIDRVTLDRLAQQSPSMPSPWPAGAIDDLVGLLLCGHDALPVLEALDQRGLWVKVLPEWAPNRARPQRNAYHRFTVDRHLWEAAAQAAHLAERVARPDLLVLGALFHDIGKGYPGDHSDEGVKLFDRVGRRMGLDDDDVEVVCRLIRHHLLLAEVATQRDLADDATINLVAEAVVDATTLSVLHALTEADSLATGASAWSSWKADLIETLVSRVGQVLGGETVDSSSWRLFPDAEVLEMMAAGELAFRAGPTTLTVVGPDRPGMFSKAAGAMAVHSLDVLGAEAHSDEGGESHRSMAASEFRVAPTESGAGGDVGADVDWQPVIATIRSALEGGIDLGARLAERARTRRAPRPMRAGARPDVRVTVDNDASSDSTFVGVRAADGIGILYRITTALADAGLDIRHARVQTIGDEVVDTFYVRGADGGKIVDPETQARLIDTVRTALAEDSDEGRH